MNLRARGGKVAPGDVDGDRLLAIGSQALDQQRQVGIAAGRSEAGAADRECGELAFGHEPAIVQQPSDQRGLAVISRAAGQETQQLHVSSADSPR
jgi:hypothetical protein